MSDFDGLVLEIAGAIERYLQLRPEAADTAEGITAWWLSYPIGKDTSSAVNSALDLLESRGVVIRKQLEGGATIYSSALRGLDSRR